MQSKNTYICLSKRARIGFKPPRAIASPLMLRRWVKKKDCLWNSSMAKTIGPSKLLLRVFFEPLLSAMRDSSMVRTM